jgi:hypothetical protein
LAASGQLNDVLMGMTNKFGRGERIRTSGLYVPNVALYQAKLHPDDQCNDDDARDVDCC